MNVNDLIEVRIESVAFGGSGVARIDNFVIFIPFTLPGEIVRAIILKVKSNYAEAKPIEIIDPSLNRIAPKCKYFGVCGGCAYQNIPYKNQLEIKTLQLKELYKQISNKTDLDLHEAVPSSKEWGYRTKIRLKYKKIRGEFKFGYFDHYNNELIDIESCPIASMALNEYLLKVRDNNFEFFKHNRIKAYNLAFIDTFNGVVDNLGKNHEICSAIMDKIFYYNRDSFFQINHSIFELVFLELFDILKKCNAEFNTLLDMFSGVGFFGVMLAEKFKKIIFIEENKTSCSFIRKNINVNNINNKCEIICHSADRAVSLVSSNPDVILLDPPRSGASDISIKQICNFSPKLIVYISCNPGTQFRDSLIFEEVGYNMVYLKPFDFFPHTKHIETIAVFKRKEDL